jgi:acetyltransferase-like isoleucine patch superfamily enzyme
VEIKVYGDNNQIVIESNNYINDIRIAIEDDNNLIKISNNVYIGPDSLLAALEGTKIKIGKECMIAGPCEIRTSDSHSLTDLEGYRINPAKDIEIGEHVWIGAGCMLLKGCKIPDHTIVAARSLITSTKDFEPYSLWGGVPARLLKKGVNWKKERK